MFATISDVSFMSHGIQFHTYPFPPASIFPAQLLAWHAVQEIVIHAAPPEVRTKQGEVLFIPATQTDALAQASHVHAIPLVNRVDLWELILEPFVDTVFGEAHQERTLSVLEAHGIDRDACSDLRRRISTRMLAYNAVLWEWVHLGQYDLLVAHRPFMRRERFEQLYWSSMDIAHIHAEDPMN